LISYNVILENFYAFKFSQYHSLQEIFSTPSPNPNMSNISDNVNRGNVRRTLDTTSYVNELTMRSNALAMRLEQFRDFILDDPRGVDESIVREISLFIAYMRHLEPHIRSNTDNIREHLTRPLPPTPGNKTRQLMRGLQDLIDQYNQDDTSH